MSMEMMTAKMELKELVDVFSNLADVKDAAGQGELFLPDGVLEFQMGFDGAIQNIVGREALVAAFAATINPCKAVYHINGQHTVTLNDDCTEAEGTAYCQATLVNEGDGKDVIEEGLIRGWGLSQVDVDIIDRAQRVTPLSAIQNIYSMVERDSEARVIPYCMANNIGFVPFSPIASGLLSGKITPQTQFETYDDVRNWVPQLSRANIAGNQPIVDLLKKYASKKKATPAQVSLA